MRHSGFTLIEILISALLLMIVGSGIISTFIAADRIYYRENALLQMQQNARLALDAMGRELRAARNISINETADNMTFDTASEAGLHYYLNASSSQIVRECPACSARILGNDIAYLNFTLDGSVMEIRLRAAKTVRGATLVFPSGGNLTERVKLRNG